MSRRKISLSEWSRIIEPIQTSLVLYKKEKRSLDPSEKARERVLARISNDIICPLCQIPIDSHITLFHIVNLDIEINEKTPDEMKIYYRACKATGDNLSRAGIYNTNICIPCCIEFHKCLNDYEHPRFGRLHRPYHAKLHELKNSYFPGFTQRAHSNPFRRVLYSTRKRNTP